MTADLPDVEILDVFVIDGDGRLATAEPWQRPPNPTPARPTKQPSVVDTPPEATPPKPSGTGAIVAAPPIRTIGLFDVFHAVPVPPTQAHRILTSERPFPGVAGIEIDEATLAIDALSLTWRVRLRTAPGRWRDAELLVHPSPSCVLTVIELRPSSRRRASGRFIRSGVEVVGELAGWLNARAAIA